LASESAGRAKVSQFRADGKASNLAVDFGMSADLGHQVCAAKVNRRSSSAVAVIDGFGGSRVDINAKDRHLIVLSGVLIRWLRCGILRENSSREHNTEEWDENNVFHNDHPYGKVRL
jgi:hypothetical protein